LLNNLISILKPKNISYSKGVATGDHLSVKPTKIAAGVEAEKTNELLQALARAINKKVK